MTATIEAEQVDSRAGSPRYRHLLRPIGAYLDALQAAHLLIAESEEGFIWRCFTRQQPDRVLYGVIAHAEVPRLIESMKAARLGRVPDLDGGALTDAVCPYGYEELLRCLSYKLDRQGADSFLLLEDESSVLLQCTVRVPMYLRQESESFVSTSFFRESVMTRQDIECLVRHVRGFRGMSYFG